MRYYCGCRKSIKWWNTAYWIWADDPSHWFLRIQWDSGRSILTYIDSMGNNKSGVSASLAFVLHIVVWYFASSYALHHLPVGCWLNHYCILEYSNARRVWTKRSGTLHGSVRFACAPDSGDWWHGKSHNAVVTTIARELAAFIWSMANKTPIAVWNGFSKNNTLDNLILMDIMMPETNWLQAVLMICEQEALRNIPVSKRVKVIMTTWLDHPLTVLKVLYESDATSYLIKPISWRQMASARNAWKSCIPNL